MQPSVDPSVANACELTVIARADAGAGLAFDAPGAVLLPRGSVLCRVGHAVVRRVPVPEADNYMSPWWISEADFLKILALGQRDAAWAARVALAIAEQWGGDCSRLVRVVLAEPLYAWRGQGRRISGGRTARAVPAHDPRAYWYPDASIRQLYIPGLRRMAAGRSCALWAAAFVQRQCLPLLLAGQQDRLGSGLPFADRTALPAGRRAGSVA